MPNELIFFLLDFLKNVSICFEVFCEDFKKKIKNFILDVYFFRFEV